MVWLDAIGYESTIWTFGVSEHVFTGLYFQFMASFISVCAKMIAYTVPSLHLFWYSTNHPNTTSQWRLMRCTMHHHANHPSIASMTHCHSADISPWNPTKKPVNSDWNPMKILMKSHSIPRHPPKIPSNIPSKIPWKSHKISMEFPWNRLSITGTGGKALRLGGASGATRVEPAERCVASSTRRLGGSSFFTFCHASVGKADGPRWGYGFKWISYDLMEWFGMIESDMGWSNGHRIWDLVGWCNGYNAYH